MKSLRMLGLAAIVLMGVGVATAAADTIDPYNNTTTNSTTTDSTTITNNTASTYRPPRSP